MIGSALSSWIGILAIVLVTVGYGYFYIKHILLAKRKHDLHPLSQIALGVVFLMFVSAMIMSIVTYTQSNAHVAQVFNQLRIF